MVYGGDSYGPYTTHTMDGIYARGKYEKLIAKYTADTTQGSFTLEQSKDMEKGLNRMYDYIGTREKFGTVPWDCAESDIMKCRIPQNNASGLQPGRNTKSEGELGSIATVSWKEERC